MFKKIITAIFLILLTSVTVEAQGDLNALDYIPPSNFVTGWTATGNEFISRAEGAGYLLGDSIPLLLEYDLTWYATETYSRGQDEMTIEIFEFPSVSDAYGYYNLSYIRLEPSDPDSIEVTRPYGSPPSSEIDTIRRVTSPDGDLLEGYKDRFYFRVITIEDEIFLSGIQAGLYLLARLPGISVAADMIGMLPRDDLVRGTERYIRGPGGLSHIVPVYGDDLFGFDDYEWEAVAGEYRLGGGEYYLLVIAEYSDIETAEIVQDRLQDYFQDNRWETVIVSPLPSGMHPRAFRDETYTAFWADRNYIWLLWDLTDVVALGNALSQY